MAFSERQDAETTTDQWLPAANEGREEGLTAKKIMRKVTGAVESILCPVVLTVVIYSLFYIFPPHLL